MITDADIKKMKVVFATKDELKSLDSKVDIGFQEILKFIGEIKDDIMKEFTEFKKEMLDFRDNMNDFRDEMRDINRRTQSILNIHETRINRLEYSGKT